MKVTPIRTNPILAGDDMYEVLDRTLSMVEECSILAVTSKIVSICEGVVVKNDGTIDKHTLVKREADAYLDVPLSQTYGVTITIKRHMLVVNTGIDESNGNGYFILWPRDPYKSAVAIWNYIRKKYHLAKFGVIITDSHVIPLQWGTRGRALSWCGIEPLKNYIGTPDIFGKNLRMTKESIADGLSAAAVAVMGEGNEQTPLALITDIPFVQFQDRPPTKKEIASLTISLSDDIYAPFLNSVRWMKTRKSNLQ